MAWVVAIVRVLFGAFFVISGLNGLVPEPFMPTPAFEGQAKEWLGILVASNYMKVVKVLELLGGLFILSGRLAPLGLTLLTPVTVNILLFEIFLLGEPGMGIVWLGLCIALIGFYWRYFASVFTTTATLDRPTSPVHS